MNGILLVDFNLVACDFLKYDWHKMLNGYVDFSFNISLKCWKIEDGLNKT